MSFIGGFVDELTKTAMSSGLIRRVVTKELAHDPNRVGSFIQHLGKMHSPHALEAKDLAVQEARKFLSGTPQFAAARAGNPSRAVAGVIESTK